MPKVRALYFDEPNALDPDVPVIAVDSSIIDLSFALCPWASWNGTDAAVERRAAVDLRGPIPAFLNITPATYGDVCWLDELPFEPGAFCIMDRGYIDFRRLRRIARVRGLSSEIVPTGVTASSLPSRLTAPPACAPTSLFGLSRTDAPKHWPALLRRVSLHDLRALPTPGLLDQSMGGQRLYQSPSFIVTAGQIELFFRRPKHGLRMRIFYGTTANAVRLRLRASIRTCLAMAITRKQLGITTNPTTFVQVLSLHAISKTPAAGLFADSTAGRPQSPPSGQLMSNDLK